MMTCLSSAKIFALEPLQVYARQVFIPAVQAIEAMYIVEEEKKSEPMEVSTEHSASTPVPGQQQQQKKSKMLEGLEDNI